MGRDLNFLMSTGREKKVRCKLIDKSSCNFIIIGLVLRDVSLNERCEMIIDEQALPPTEAFLGTLTVIVVYSAVTEYTKYICSLKEQATLRDTFIYQVNSSVFFILST